MAAATPITVSEVEVRGLRLSYREAGSGPPVLLLHGWPTSSFLWRGVMPAIAAGNRVVALDLPGYGGSAKPLDVDYGFAFHDDVIDGFLAALGVDEVGLAVHDIGGPIGLHWAVARPRRITRLALLNTLVYPQLSPAARAFLLACRTPLVRDYITSARGLERGIRLGMAKPENVTAEVIEGVQAPFRTKQAREALTRAALGLEPAGLVEIERRLPTLEAPALLLYGERDRLLPDVAKTMARVKRDLPQAELAPLPDVGHFLQEDDPERVGELLAGFLAPD